MLTDSRLGRFAILMAKTLFIAAPGVVLVVFGIHLLHGYLVSRYGQGIPPWLANGLGLGLAYLIGKWSIGKDLAEIGRRRAERLAVQPEESGRG